PRAPIPTYYYISARGLFGEIFRTKTVCDNPNFPKSKQPVTIYHYDKDNPASSMPFLVWHVVPEAVCYEVEILNAQPPIEGGIKLSEEFTVFSTRKVYTNGYQADLRPYENENELYWRVRALGLHHEPIGEFCKAEKIVVDKDKTIPNCPLVNNFDLMDYLPQPIYHAFSWIPLNSAAKYEVELLTHPPEVENDVEPSKDSHWRMTTTDVASCYDEYGRPYAGPYYWRVRALDEENNPIGTWSNSDKFVVEDYTQGVDVVVLGDSVTHGGAALSYSPRDLQYSYETYIDFPVVNLGRSGDLAHDTLARFEHDVLPLKPRNLILLTGENCLRDASIKAEDVIADIEGIKKLCLANNIRPIFLTLMPIHSDNIYHAFKTISDPNWREKLNKINEYIKRQEYVIDIEPYFCDKDGSMKTEMAVDGIHPDIQGKMLIGELISKNKDMFILK
ncbi:MAG: GDSL family lipase, partial [Selenomonadaceae bacterium]|nr:GDSL family lipase [Selenomonadaceae bacterium]